MMPRITLLSLNTVGDSLYWAVIAYNLVRMGYEVVFYSNALVKMSSSIKGYQILPYPLLFGPKFGEALVGQMDFPGE